MPLLQALPEAAAGVAVDWALIEGEDTGVLETEGLPVVRRDAELVPEALTERLAWGLAVPMPPAPTVVGVAGALSVREAVGETLALGVALPERAEEPLGRGDLLPLREERMLGEGVKGDVGVEALLREGVSVVDWEVLPLPL